MFPLHVWLPDAHPAAPAPASALLSGIMIKTGAYGLIRVFHNVYSPRFFEEVNWEIAVVVLASVTILLGSALAILQDNLKRRLAYSSIAQIGYILLGISLLSERAMVGAVYHIFTHAMMKGCLFLCAGAIIVQTGKKNISEMGGIGFKMPLTMLCFTIASFSMVGIPPFNGFISKWQLSLAALELNRPEFVALLIISSLLNAVYYFPIIIAAFFNRRSEAESGAHNGHGGHPPHEDPAPALSLSSEAPWEMLVPTAVLAVGCFIFALTPVNWPLEMIKTVATALF
jgi:multicomponent Na+:H+ antiporter subunit D